MPRFLKTQVCKCLVYQYVSNFILKLSTIGFVVEVMLVDFLGLKEVAFELVVCSMECSIPIRAAMVQKQKETREKQERDYEEMIEAHRKECEEHEQAVLRTLAANRPKRNHRRNQNRRACVIM